MDISSRFKKNVLKTALDCIEENVHRLMEWVDKFAGGGPYGSPGQGAAFRQILTDPENNMYKPLIGVFRDIGNGVVPPATPAA